MKSLWLCAPGRISDVLAYTTDVKVESIDFELTLLIVAHTLLLFADYSDHYSLTAHTLHAHCFTLLIVAHTLLLVAD